MPAQIFCTSFLMSIFAKKRKRTIRRSNDVFQSKPNYQKKNSSHRTRQPKAMPKLSKLSKLKIERPSFLIQVILSRVAAYKDAPAKDALNSFFVLKIASVASLW